MTGGVLALLEAGVDPDFAAFERAEARRASAPPAASAAGKYACDISTTPAKNITALAFFAKSSRNTKVSTARHSEKSAPKPYGILSATKNPSKYAAAALIYTDTIPASTLYLLYHFSIAAISAILFSCLPPSNGSDKNVSQIINASSLPMTLPPIHKIFASLCRLVIFAE